MPMIDENQDVEFMVDISRQVKDFYESAVIYITEKDYSDTLFDTLCSLRTALREDDKKRVIDLIVDYHLQWLHAINEIEKYKNNFNEKLPRDQVYHAITYTIDMMASRLKYFERYMEKYRPILSNTSQNELVTDLEIVEEMHRDVTHILLEKLKCFKNYHCFEEFKVHVTEAIEDLLTWVDKIYDGISIKISNYINVNVPHLSGDLTKTLQQIVDDLQSDESPAARKLVEQLKAKGREMGSLLRCTAGHNLEISKVFEKINVLDDRLKRLESEPNSAAVMALQHKKEYLEKRMASLENLKTTIKSMQNLTDVKLYDDVKDDELCPCEDFYQLRIFNHLLPEQERERLVTELCALWDKAVFGERSRSIISILSAADMKEEYTDELGTFFIDEHSRKIYRVPDDDVLYQANERNELVPVKDDEENVYFYDECGRYFVDAKTNQRVYKAHATASEYMMDSTGVLLKVKEVRDGITYHYDQCGRYYIDSDGKHIYRDEDRLSEYENDGLGNLVRIRSHLDIFEPCPGDAYVSEDVRYLKTVVGPALRVCIGNVLMHQPSDPVKFLSHRLIKYRENEELRELRAREKEQLDVERQIIAEEERAAAERAAMEAALLTQGGSEASYDSNMVMYTSMHPDDQLSIGGTSSK
ncbi:unnamed protein product [Chrysodeixis includens]|uniref:Uncharacterized protein n=1 Tax=Chrysodeixis includens TaxID=689277 RepID=A0A9N8KXQ5_CHRIL|nr:unnamed protein product [Chrysodeixis includens]